MECELITLLTFPHFMFFLSVECHGIATTTPLSLIRSTTTLSACCKEDACLHAPQWNCRALFRAWRGSAVPGSSFRAPRAFLEFLSLREKRHSAARLRNDTYRCLPLWLSLFERNHLISRTFLSVESWANHGKDIRAQTVRIKFKLV